MYLSIKKITLAFKSLPVSLRMTMLNIQNSTGARFALSVFYVSQNRQRLLLYTLLIYSFL